MTWRFFLFVVVAMETSKKLFFLDTGQKQFLTVVFSMSRNWNIFFSFCSRLVECRWTTDDVFYNWNYTFELLAIFLHHFVFWYPIYALIPRLSPIFFLFFVLNICTSYTFTPFNYCISCICFQCILRKNTYFGHCVFNKELIAWFAFWVSI